ncbi:MAG: hypothetical protein FJ146_19350 [Deltaproteobacteria bacterium]|nr:hypothetical protein [Deltaproteobacteria bacterium]
MQKLFVQLQLLATLIVGGTEARAHTDDGSGLKTCVTLDLMGSFNAPRMTQATDRFAVRESELLLYGPIDHLFDGVLNVAAHGDTARPLVEPHEAYIGSSKLIPRSRFRLGQFFLGLGRLNHFHRHDWPVVTAPKSQLEFFGSEGAFDTGAEYTYLAPLPFFLELTAGVTNGWTYGHVHNAGVKPRVPTTYGRAATYLSLPAGGGMQTAVNYLTRKSAQGDSMTLSGIDLTAKWRQPDGAGFLLQGEIWQRQLAPLVGKEERSVGLYVLPQYSFSPEWHLGLLLDYFTVLSLKDISGKPVANAEQRYVPTLTYKSSEFVTFRAAFDWTTAKQQGVAERFSKMLLLQAAVNLGAHPAHEF